MSLVIPPRFNFDLTYYVSGPMSGYPENNFPAFAHTSEILRENGILVLSPHEVNHGNYTAWQAFLRRDIYEMTRFCDGIILIKGWPQSAGAGMESGIAVRLNYPTYYFDEREDEYAELIDMNKAA